MAGLEKLKFVIVMSYRIAVYMYSNMKHSVLQAAVHYGKNSDKEIKFGTREWVIVSQSKEKCKTLV